MIFLEIHSLTLTVVPDERSRLNWSRAG